MKVFCSIKVLTCIFFVKKIISFSTYFSRISHIQHLLDVILCLRRVFGAHYPLRHWLPLTRRINLDSSKRKVDQISFRKYSRCDAWRVTDINWIYPRHVRPTKVQISMPAQSEQYSLLCFFDSRISTDVKASLIMLKLECQWCSLFLWLRRLVWILPGQPRNP